MTTSLYLGISIQALGTVFVYQDNKRTFQQETVTYLEN